MKNKGKNKVIRLTLLMTMLFALLVPVAMNAIVIKTGTPFAILVTENKKGKRMRLQSKVKTFPDGVYGYCLNYNLPTPGSGTDIPVIGEYANKNVWKTIKYGYPNTKFYNTGDTTKDEKLNFYVTQIVVWSFVEGWDDARIDGMTKAWKGGVDIIDTDINVLKNHIKNLRAKVIKDTEAVTPSVSFSPKTVNVVGKPGENAKTGLITVTGKNLAGNATISLVDAPKGAQIKGENGNPISSIPIGGKFFIEIPNAAPSGTLKFKLSGNGQTFKGIKYEGGQGNQDIVRYEPVSIPIPAGATGVVTWQNKPGTGKAEILKIEAGTAKPIAGVTFDIMKGAAKVTTVTTNDQGKASLDLPIGDYTAVEKSAPPQYVVDPTPHPFTITGKADKIPVVRVENTIVKGTIRILKTDKETGEKLPGAKFTLSQNGQVKHEVTTGNDGVANIDNVVFGTYTVEEVEAPEGYLRSEIKQDVTINKPNQRIEVSAPNQVIKGKIQIVKIDANDEEKPIEGAVFELYKVSDLNKPLAKLTTDKDGFAYTEDLRYGDYVLKEVDAPGDYYISDKLYPVSIRENGKVVVQYIVNKPVEFRLQVLKVDGETQKPLEGAHFQIHQDGKPVEFTYQAGSQIVKETTFISDKDGLILLPTELRAGKYQLVEVKPPAGYKPIDPIDFEITRDTKFDRDELGPIFKIEVKNDSIKGNVELIKVDANDSNKKLEGVKFELYKTNKIPDTAGSGDVNKDEAVKPGDSSKDGNMVEKIVKGVKRLFVKDLNAKPLSSALVTMEDTKSLSQGLLPRAGEGQSTENNDNQQPPTNGGDTQTPPTGDTSKPNEDSSKPEGEDASKSNEDSSKPNEEDSKPDQDTSKPVKEWSENLLTEEQKPLENGDQLIGIYKTDANGSIRINNLKFGNYYFKEVETVEGYVLADKPIPFQITEDGKKVEVTATNKPITGKVEITKTDVSTGESLPDTGIKIYMEDKKTVVFEGRTDSNGKVTFGPLEYGKYFFQEFDAPEGYVIDETLFPFEIKEDGEIVKCKMTNKKITGQLEITKVDVSDGKLLPNTTFAIYDESGKEVVVKGKTDSNGIAKFKLDYGKYYYQEIEAPEGYMIDQTKFPFEIKTDGEIIKCKMTNTKLPKTGTVPINTLATMIPVAVIGLSGAFVLTRKK